MFRSMELIGKPTIRFLVGRTILGTPRVPLVAVLVVDLPRLLLASHRLRLAVILLVLPVFQRPFVESMPIEPVNCCILSPVSHLVYCSIQLRRWLCTLRSHVMLKTSNWSLMF